MTDEPQPTTDGHERQLGDELVAGPLAVTWAATPAALAADAPPASTRLPEGVSAGIRDLIAAGRGVHKASADAAQKAWTVVLKPTEATKLGLRNKSLTLTTKGRDAVIAQARDVKTGSVVENIKIDTSQATALSGSKGISSMKAAASGAAVAWKVMAIVTQQHYLTEISGRLDGIAGAVDELLQRALVDKAAGLKARAEALDRLETHVRGGAALTLDDRRAVEEWFTDTRAVWHAQIEFVERGIADRKPPAAIVDDLLVADFAVTIAARCARVAWSLPFEDDKRRFDVLSDYAERVEGAVGRADACALALGLDTVDLKEEWRLRNEQKAVVLPLPATALSFAVPGLGFAVAGLSAMVVRDEDPKTGQTELHIRRFGKPSREISSVVGDWVAARAERAAVGPALEPVTVYLDAAGNAWMPEMATT